jgi:hypothetical protein
MSDQSPAEFGNAERQSKNVVVFKPNQEYMLPSTTNGPVTIVFGRNPASLETASPRFNHEHQVRILNEKGGEIDYSISRRQIGLKLDSQAVEITNLGKNDIGVSLKQGKVTTLKRGEERKLMAQNDLRNLSIFFGPYQLRTGSIGADSASGDSYLSLKSLILKRVT